MYVTYSWSQIKNYEFHYEIIGIRIMCVFNTLIGKYWIQKLVFKLIFQLDICLSN